MLYSPGHILILCEVKFTSPNKVAYNSEAENGDKPNDIAGNLRRYAPSAIPSVVDTSGASDPFYTQLYRNLVFPAHMANTLNVRWHVANLINKTQWAIWS